MRQINSSFSYKVVPKEYKCEESPSFIDVNENKTIEELRTSLSNKLWKLSNSFDIKPKIQTICWNFDDSKIAAGIGSDQINIWDLKSNTLIKEISEVNQGIAWHPNEDKLIYYAINEFINVLDLKSDNVNAKTIPFKKNAGEDFFVDWHPKKQLFVHSGSGNKINICDFDNTIDQISQEEKCLDVKFNIKGNKLASIGLRSVCAWDYETKIQIFKYEDKKSQISCFSWSKDENKIYFISSQMIRIFDIEQDLEIAYLSSIFSEFISFDCSLHDENLIAVIDQDKTFNIWDISASIEIFEWKNTKNFFNIKWSHSGSLIALADSNGIEIFEWNIDFDSKSAKRLDIGENKIFRAVFGPDGNKLLICSESSIIVWDLFCNSKEEINLNSDDYDSITDIRWNKNGNKIIFLAEEYEKIYLWDYDRKTLLKAHEFDDGNENSFRIARFGFDENLIALAGNKVIEIRDLQEFKVIQIIQAHSRNITDLRWNEMGTELLSTSRDKSIKIWDTNNWEEKLKILGHFNFVNCAMWDKNEEYIISAGADQYLRIFNSEDGNEIRSILTKEQNIRSLTLFRGEFIATLNPANSSIKIWDIKTGIQLKSKTLKHGKIFNIDANQQGNKIALATDNGTIIYEHDNIWEDFEEHKFLYFLFEYLSKCKEINLKSKEVITKIVNYYFLHKISAFHLLIEKKKFDEFNDLIYFCLKNGIVCKRFHDSWQKPLFKLMNNASEEETNNNDNTKNPSTLTPLVSIDLFIEFVISSNPDLGCLFYVEQQSLMRYTIKNSEKLCQLLESRFKKIENSIFDAKWSDDRKQSSSLTIKCNEIRKSILFPEKNAISKHEIQEKVCFSGAEIYERNESSQRPIFKMMDIPVFLLSYEFIKACCGNRYFEEICKSRVIISLIDVLWVNHVRKKFIKKNFIYFLYFFLLIGNSIVVSPYYIRDKENHSNSNFWLPFLILSILLAIILIFMVKIEIDEWRQNKNYYFKSVWNYADHLNIIFSFLSFIFNIVVLSEATRQFGLLRVLQSISFFFSMIRMFDFFRAFKSTCFLIEMILQVIVDMRVFLFLMMLFVTVFSLSSIFFVPLFFSLIYF